MSQVTVADQAEITENLADECLHINSLLMEAEPVATIAGQALGPSHTFESSLESRSGWDDAKKGVDYLVVSRLSCAFHASWMGALQVTVKQGAKRNVHGDSLLVFSLKLFAQLFY